MTDKALGEKQAVKEAVGDLAASCLWDPGFTEGYEETSEHIIHVWRAERGVVATIVHR